MAPQNIIAVVFDFDDTLTDETTTKLLESHGINAREFWGKRQRELLEQGWDPALAYLKLILDETGEGKPLGKLTNKKLREFGAGLNFYQGIPDLFNDLQALAKKYRRFSPAVEFYIVSSGLEEIIRGTKYANYFSDIWGCRFAEEDGQIRHIMNVVSFTEKTKFLYAIHKGTENVRENPYGVNEKVERQNRRVPFENMIYIGDGMTDVPCFSMLDHYRGKPFGVFDPNKVESPKKAWEGLIAPKRVYTMNSPKYGEKDDLGSLLRAAVESALLQIQVNSQAAL